MRTEFLWLPMIAIAAHMFEEFVWPGGFMKWYQRYPPGCTVLVTARFLWLMNAVFVALAALPPLLGPTHRGFAFWIVVAAVAGANGIFHIVAAVRTRAYAPGVVTGVCLYLPLAVVGGISLVQRNLVAPGTAIQAVVVAVGYHVWSAWKHQRGAIQRSTS